MPSDEEIKACRLVLTDDRIAELHRGVAVPGLVIKLMLEGAEQVRAAPTTSQPSTTDWDQPQLWPPPRTTDKSEEC